MQKPGFCAFLKKPLPLERWYNEEMRHPLVFLGTILFLFMSESCAIPPSENDLKGAITNYFDSRDYRVIDIRIGKIEGVPLAEKTYMGTPGYIVEIPSITLEAKQDKAPDISKGDRLTFSNAIIRVRRDQGNSDLWRVSIVSGVSVN